MKISLFILSTILFLSISISFSKVNYAGEISEDSVKLCIVSGQELGEDAVTITYFKDTLELCCNVCVQAFQKEPAKYLKGDLYCPVCDDYDAKKEIFSVYEKTKYYFCNDGCKENFESNPEEILNSSAEK